MTWRSLLTAELAAPGVIKDPETGPVGAQRALRGLKLTVCIERIPHLRFLNSAASFCLASSADLSGFQPSESLKWKWVQKLASARSRMKAASGSRHWLWTFGS